MLATGLGMVMVQTIFNNFYNLFSKLFVISYIYHFCSKLWVKGACDRSVNKIYQNVFASLHNSQICISPIRRQIYYHFYFIVILLKMCFALAACKCIFTAVACMWHIKTNDLKQLKAHETNYVLIGGHFSSIALICNQNILC